MGRPDIARKRADLGFAVTAAYMLSCGLIFCLGQSADGHIRLRPASASHRRNAPGFRRRYQFFDAMYIVYNGALRGAGDTFIPAIATASLCWGLTVFGGYIVATRFTHWGAPALGRSPRSTE